MQHFAQRRQRRVWRRRPLARLHAEQRLLCARGDEARLRHRELRSSEAQLAWFGLGLGLGLGIELGFRLGFGLVLRLGQG